MPREKKPHLKKRPDGRYACRYKGEWFYGATEAEALAARDAYKKAEADGYLAALHGPTVGQYAAKWLPTHRAGVSPATYGQYASLLETVVQPIAHIRLPDLKADDVSAALSQLVGKSGSYIHKASNLLTAMLDAATDSGYLPRNPCRSTSVDVPRGPSGSHRAITQAERQLILDTPHRLRPVVLLMLYAGLRPEEARAIDTTRDVDYVHKVITVSRTVTFQGNRPIIGTGKTGNAARRVLLMPILEDALADVHGPVLTMEDGSPVTASAWTRAWNSYVTTVEEALNGCPRRWYGRTRAHLAQQAQADALRAEGRHEEALAAALPPWQPFTVRPYDLRHSFCTMCRDAGVDMHVCMTWMGHSDERLILRIYDHVTDYRQQLSAQALLSFGFGSQNGSQNCIEHPETVAI